VQHNEQGHSHIVEMQQKLYLDYALAAEKYGKKPTLNNWEKKEKAFENYNALFNKEVNY